MVFSLQTLIDQADASPQFPVSETFPGCVKVCVTDATRVNEPPEWTKSKQNPQPFVRIELADSSNKVHLLFFGNRDIEVAKRMVEGLYYRIQHFNVYKLNGKKESHMSMTFRTGLTQIERLDTVPVDTCQGPLSTVSLTLNAATVTALIGELTSIKVKRICACCTYDVLNEVCQRSQCAGEQRGAVLDTKSLIINFKAQDIRFRTTDLTRFLTRGSDNMQFTFWAKTNVLKDHLSRFYRDEDLVKKFVAGSEVTAYTRAVFEQMVYCWYQFLASHPLVAERGVCLTYNTKQQGPSTLDRQGSGGWYCNGIDFDHYYEEDVKKAPNYEACLQSVRDYLKWRDGTPRREH